MFRSTSDTFLVESKTRSTFDLQRRLRLLLGQEYFDSKTSSKIFSIRMTIGEFPFSGRKKILYSGKNLKKKALYWLSSCLFYFSIFHFSFQRNFYLRFLKVLSLHQLRFFFDLSVNLLGIG